MGLDTPIINSLTLLVVGGLGAWILYALLIGYVIGSIPFGLVLTRAAGLGDIRQIGSGNIGATNVLRTGRKGLAAATLVFDGLKATFAAWLAAEWFGHAPAVAAAVGAVIGHLYPVWLRFKGGKGVATYIGALLALAPSAALVFIAVWITMAAWKRYSSLAALMASAAAPLVLLMTGHPLLAAVFLALTLLLYWKHRANIARLRAGTEPQIGVNDGPASAAAA